MVDSNWDVEKYKTEFESEEHWELRRKFLSAHKDTLPEDELVCFAQVFTNIEFLGCRYPDETMIRIAELAKGVVEEFREKKKNTLKRTFVAASDAASSKVKGLSSASSINRGAVQFTKTEEDDGCPAKIPKNSMIVTPGSGRYGRVVVILNKSVAAIQLLDRITALNRINTGARYDVKPIDGDLFEASYILEGVVFSQAVAMDKKSSKELAAVAAIERLRETCYTVIMKERDIDEGESVGATDLDGKHLEEKIGEDNVGNKLMKLMGWSGGGLGRKQQGRVEPVTATTTVNRSGLGINEFNQNIIPFRESVKKYLVDWLSRGAPSDLIFSSEFDKEQRKTTHEIAQKLGLKTKSYGAEGDRKLVVSKKEDLWSVVEDLARCGGTSEKYRLIPPGEPLPADFTENSLLNRTIY